MNDPPRSPFPFDAVVGQDHAKLALRLAATDLLIGGVLLRGQKGSAKTTLARGLASLLGDAPFVDLPLGASEDRVVGTLDTRAALTGGEIRFEPGLLARADGGVLYVDEINLLPDHLVDVLLDVTVSGENVVERDGLSHRHRARFVLVGSMNPEEGELRPQLLDRFGLCVDVVAPTAIEDRVEAVRRRLDFDAGRSPDRGPEVSDRAPARDARPGASSSPLSDEVVEAASRLALEVGAEGLRADLTLCRAARALAAIEGRDVAEVDDLRRVAALVLSHRSRRGPFDPPMLAPDEVESAVDRALPHPDPTPDPDDDGGEGPCPHGDEAGADEDGDDGGNEVGGSGGIDEPDEDGSGQDRADEGAGPSSPGSGRSGRGPGSEATLVIGPPRRPPTPARGTGDSPRGRVIGDGTAVDGGQIAVLPTVRAVARRRREDPEAVVAEGDLRTARRVAPRSLVIVLCVDLSGSMGAAERAGAASGTVLGLLADAYQRRYKVALVTFRGDQATTVLSPTRSVEVARNRLGELVTGGETPLALGLVEALRVAERAMGEGTDGLIVVLTDGRATGSGGLDAAMDAARAIGLSQADALVLDCEDGAARLGLADRLAEVMAARYVAVSDLAPTNVAGVVRDLVTRHP